MSIEFVIGCIVALIGLCLFALVVTCAVVQVWRDYQFGRRNRRRRGYVLGGPSSRRHLP